MEFRRLNPGQYPFVYAVIENDLAIGTITKHWVDGTQRSRGQIAKVEAWTTDPPTSTFKKRKDAAEALAALPRNSES